MSKGSPIFVFSIPKAGTHLVTKALSGLPGIQHGGKHFARSLRIDSFDRGADLPLTGTTDRALDLPWMRRFFASIKPNTFVTTHTVFDEMLQGLLRELGYKIIVVERDPRDIVVSWADFVPRVPDHLLNPFVSGLSADERIACGIRGAERITTGTRRQPSITELIERHMAWRRLPGVLVVRFEDLIGDQHGGHEHRTRKETIRGIADYLGQSCSEDTIDTISDSLFGGTYTFNQGRVGRWRERFSREHVALFNQIAGNGLAAMEYETGT